MKVVIEISEKVEATQAPFWLILDPKQNMECDIYNLAGQITGPFFSREEAEQELESRSYNYSDRARVFCLSGWRSGQYAQEYRKAQEATR